METILIDKSLLDRLQRQLTDASHMQDKMAERLRQDVQALSDARDLLTEAKARIESLEALLKAKS